MRDFLTDQLTLIQLDDMHRELTSHTILKNAKLIAMHIMNINIAYASCHTPYKAFKRLNDNIRQYLWHKPFDIIANTLSNYRTADQMIGDFMEDQRERDSDCSLDEDDDRAYDSLMNWFGKKQNYYKMYKDLYCESLDKRDYKPLTQHDTVKMFKNIRAKVLKFRFSKKEIKDNKEWQAAKSKFSSESHKN